MTLISDPSFLLSPPRSSKISNGARFGLHLGGDKSPSIALRGEPPSEPWNGLAASPMLTEGGSCPSATT